MMQMSPSPSVPRPPSPPALRDRQGRLVDYLRLSVTDRCNLRCRYCRPEEGVPFVPHEEILTFEELERLTALFCDLGVVKVRVTGGEPFARKGCLPFLQRLKEIDGLRNLHVTTNGVETERYLDALAELGITGINLSLDTLEPRRFRSITRHDSLADVLSSLDGILERRLPLKVNSVVLEDTADDEIVRLAGLARGYPLTVRFIERMPFSGSAARGTPAAGNLEQRLRHLFPALRELPRRGPATARLFVVPGYQGLLGVIEGHSRRFCDTCNKVRITPMGMLKTCLYDNGVLDLKNLLRTGAGDRQLKGAIFQAVQKRCRDGHESERLAGRLGEPSMAAIGG